MGGEPTFVSIDDLDGAEWNTIALGPTKRRLADDLIKRLKRRFTCGALLHYGQGKWYPGESLPRWAFACYWRKDGQPIWENDVALRRRSQGLRLRESAGRGIHPRAGRASRLRQPSGSCPHSKTFGIICGKSAGCPSTWTRSKSKLKDEEERARLREGFRAGARPDRRLRAAPAARLRRNRRPCWISGPWFLRGEHCYLIPGDSPMGFRLPLDSLPWVSAGDQPYIIERDPLDAHSPLPPRQAFIGAFRQGAVGWAPQSHQSPK